MSRLAKRKLFDRPNRNLLRELIWSKFKMGDQNTFFGILWSLAGPLVFLLIMYFIFRQNFGHGVYAYPLYLLLGIVCANFFITATGYISRIFFYNRDIVLNTTIRREILILSESFVHIYKFMIELAICYILSIFYGLFSWKGFILSLPLFSAYIVFVLGISMIISLAYCFTRDIYHIWTILMRMLFFVTPIFYTLEKLPRLAKELIYLLNPLTPFVISFHEVFMSKGRIDWFTYAYSMFLAVFYFGLAYYLFVLFENKGMEKI